MKKLQFVSVKQSLMLIGMCALSVFSSVAQTKTEIIAHRGFWNTEGASQNSLAALEEAAKMNLYGSEFDVHLTSDNVLVVYHDNGIDGREVQKCKYKDLTRMRLFNGEKIPTLEKYLKKGKRLKDIELVFELKSHSTPERDDEAARKSVEMVNRMGLSDRTTYIAFSRYAAAALRKYSPESEVYYLNGDLTPRQLKDMNMSGLDYHYKVIQKNPEWVEEAHNLGLKVNVWTVNDPKVMEEMIKLGVDYITTDNPKKAVEVL